MADLTELYRQVIIEHSRKPRNFYEIVDPDCTAEGYNPLCGDRVTIYMMIDGDTVTNVTFTGQGCAICTASTSLMTQFLKGKTLDQVATFFNQFRSLVMGEVDPVDVIDDLDKLAVFSGVSEFPIRVKCATLAWHTVMAALKNTEEVVSTE